MIVGVSIAVFLIARVSGDPAALLLSNYATPADVESFRRLMGLDQPLWTQYWLFISGAVHGDFGNSYLNHLPAMQLVAIHLPVTIELAVAAMAIGILVGVPLGTAAAVWRDRPVDYIAGLFSALGQSAPAFWLGIMLILLFAVTLRWLPAGGAGSVQHLVLPATTLGIYVSAVLTRLVRVSVARVLVQDYVRTAHAKGLGPRLVLVRHVAKNAAIPVVTVLGLQFGTLLGGAVVTETVFAWPGVGQLAISAVYNRDYPLIQATVFVVAVVVVLISTLLDVLYVVLDPRIRVR